MLYPIHLTALALYLAAAPPVAEQTEPWQAVSIRVFTDFDAIEVELAGVKQLAFLVGLRPIREAVEGKVRQDRIRKEVLAKWNQNHLFARVVTRRDGRVGLSLDTFGHLRNDFGHPWDPTRYPYCWSGWGAYNFNTYLIQTKRTTPMDNFGSNAAFRQQFFAAVKRIEQQSK